MKKTAMTNPIKLIISLSGIALLFFIATRFFPADTNHDPGKVPERTDRFVLIELFTSANCSACPTAEKVVQQIRQNSGIFILAFHVDFWNQPDASDPFSSPDFSRYQQYYNHILRQRVMFTPQMIINGMTSLAGNDPRLCREKIAAMRRMKPRQPVRISAGATFLGDSIDIRFELSQPLNNARLNIALVQKKADVKMNSGQNAGRLFECFNIVRAFEHIVDKDMRAGSYKMARPAGLSADETEIILYIQNTLTYSISGATRI